MDKIHLIIIVLFLTVVSSAPAQERIKATTEDGRDVILNSNGSWKYADAAEEKASEAPVAMARPKSAKKLVKMKTGKFGLWVNEQLWKQTKSDDVNKTLFSYVSGDIYAQVIAERLEMTLDDLKELAITNAQKVAPDASIIFEQTRIVNGKKVLCMRIQGTIQGIRFIYYGYYYAGKAGTLQLLTYTGMNLFDEYQNDMTDLLNGLEIYSQN